jgi:hypothetical protein
MFSYHRLQWLFDSSAALFPSLYLSKLNMSPEQHVQFAIGRMNEAVRVARNVPRLDKPNVNAYIRYRYQDVGEFLTQVRKAKPDVPSYMNLTCFCFMKLVLPKTSVVIGCAPTEIRTEYVLNESPCCYR